MGLVRFSSKAAGEVFMFEDNAKRLFEILGKDATAKGIVTAEQVPEALRKLKAAVEEEKRMAAQARPAPAGGNRDDEQLAENAQYVRLGQRVYPLIEMLEQAARMRTDVLWGV